MGSTNSSTCDVLAKRGADRQEAIRDLMQVVKDKDLYELFELQRYSGDDDPDQFRVKVESKFRKLAMKYHPDKCVNLDKEEARANEAIFKFLESARGTLLDPDCKRRYDSELRRQRNEADPWDACRWYGRWVWNGILIVGGVALIIAGMAATVPTVGSGLTASVIGSAMLSAGIRGSSAQYRDPDQSDGEYFKEIGIGVVAGAAGGAIGGACANAIQGVSVAAQIGVAAAGGAGTSLANQIVEDVANLATGYTSLEEVCTLEHAASVGKSIVLGACAGMAVQGVAAAFTNASSSQVVDDAATAAMNSCPNAKSAALKAAELAKSTVEKSLKASRTAGKFLEGAAKKLLAGTTGTATHCLGDAAYKSAKLCVEGEVSLKDGAWQVAAETATSFAIGTVATSVTSLAAQSVEHAKAGSLLEDMQKAKLLNTEGHGAERHVAPIEAAEARSKVLDAENRGATVSVFTSCEAYETATDSMYGIDIPTVKDMEREIGVSVSCEDGKFEYQMCTKVKAVPGAGGKGLTTIYPYPNPSGSRVVDRIHVSTPFLRQLPSLPGNETSLWYHAAQAKRSSGARCTTWSSWAFAQQSSKPVCFLPRTRFTRPTGDFVTAACLKGGGGDIILGPEGQEVTVLQATTYKCSNRCLVSFLAEGMTTPFLVTADHRIVVEGSDGNRVSTEASSLAEIIPTARPRAFNGHGFVRITAAELINQETEVVEVKFLSSDDVVLAWMTAKPRSSARRHRSLPPECAVACHGAPLRTIDKIRSLHVPGLTVQHTFLTSEAMPNHPRSLSEGAKPRDIQWFSKGSLIHDEEFPEGCDICQVHHRHLLDDSYPPCTNGIACVRCHMPHEEQGKRPPRSSNSDKATASSQAPPESTNGISRKSNARAPAPARGPGQDKARAHGEGAETSPSDWIRSYVHEIGHLPSNPTQLSQFAANRGGRLAFVAAREAMKLAKNIESSAAL